MFWCWSYDFPSFSYVTTDEFELCTYLISCNLAVSWFCMFISVLTSCLFIVWSCVTTWLILLWFEVTNEYSVLICVVSSPTLLWRLLQQSKENTISTTSVNGKNTRSFNYMEIIMLSVAWTGARIYEILANFAQSAINHPCQIGIKDFTNF